MTKLIYNIVKTTSGQTGYVTLGSGRPMVMMVGYSGNLLHWNSELIHKLAEQFTLYLPDNRLVGETQSTNADSMEGMAQDSLDFIRALKLSKPLICGWSMGGIIAQAMAYYHGDEISGIGLIVSQPDYSYTMNRLHELVTNLRQNPGKENRDKLTELFFSGTPTIQFRKYMAKTILAITHYIYPFNEHAQALQNKAVANWRCDTEKLAQIKCPVLITCAKNDQVTNPQASYMLHQVIPFSKLISYPYGGHFFLHHYPQQLALEFIEFFKSGVNAY